MSVKNAKIIITWQKGKLLTIDVLIIYYKNQLHHLINIYRLKSLTQRISNKYSHSSVFRENVVVYFIMNLNETFIRVLAVSSGPEVKNTWRYTSTFARVFLHVVVLNEVHIHSTFTLTLRLLMSYIYGAPSKARNAKVIYIWTYVWQR